MRAHIVTVSGNENEEDEMSNREKEIVEMLRAEAGMHGDLEMVAVCDRALGGDQAALDECYRVLTDAMAAAD